MSRIPPGACMDAAQLRIRTSRAHSGLSGRGRAHDGGAAWSGSGSVRRDGDASVVEYLVQSA